ncbi:TPA: hypothetical protein UOA91_002878 [Stenotrophomonas maltophilia]|nr:hypothetical protein [Stenotrophomonas maltophilia]HEL3778690.1 hypothetical protein [Stenotrophomonas maltophilia]HEL5006640.1 hypothetical protein [Stenotrophomonas maltophilia]
MSTDNKTLADVQPGGSVRLATVLYDRAHDLLADAYNAGTHGIGYSQQAMELHDAIIPAQPSPGGQTAHCPVKHCGMTYARVPADGRCHACGASVQPSLGGQDALKALDDLAAFCSDDTETVDRQVAAIRAALAARQPVGQISNAEIDARLNALYREMVDSGQHNGGMSGVAWDRAVYRMAADQPAQGVDLGPVREALQAAARSLRTIADSTKETEFLETAGEIRAYAGSRANCAERALTDSKAVGNG